ncbi:hypothetical protein DY000_02018019 [Brassica cretica]|uniref:Uncharacterized protein n=1 Tax=Brassica cretica TaxID=69181 RepID=A0ABQ7DCS7_BRACR|nr:hypothetical protein DY000_02018019 [Brassica cretica]
MNLRSLCRCWENLNLPEKVMLKRYIVLEKEAEQLGRLYKMWSEDIKLVELDIKLVEQSNVIDVPGLSYRNIHSIASTAIGEMTSINIEKEEIFLTAKAVE